MAKKKVIKKTVKKVAKKSAPKKATIKHALTPEVVPAQVDKMSPYPNATREEFFEDDADEMVGEIPNGEEFPLEDDSLLPVPKAVTDRALDPQDPLTRYVREINRYELLTIDQERALTKALSETGDIEIAKKLVLANLRLVVKIALEYRSTYSNVMDLIQEGNIGLMKAVSKYDGSKGAKLSYYASWWIRSYILKFILDNFRLVKIGTTNEQKKLFYNLLREKNRLVAMGINPDTKQLAENLGVSEKSVMVMNERLGPGSSDVYLDTPLHGEDGDSRETEMDRLASPDSSVEEQLGKAQELKLLGGHLQSFLDGLKDRDKEIFTNRLLAEAPLSLQAIADQYGVTRERIRQIEERLIHSLRVYMSQVIR